MNEYLGRMKGTRRLLVLAMSLVMFAHLSYCFMPRRIASMIKGRSKDGKVSSSIYTAFPTLSLDSTTRDDVAEVFHDKNVSMVPVGMVMHHTALRTRNISNAIQFYSLFGFIVSSRFRAGPARAAWMELDGPHPQQCRLEIIEVPSYLLHEQPGVSRQRAPDLMNRQEILGFNHIALDVTTLIESNDENVTSLQQWIDELNRKSVEMFGKTLRIALPPRQQMIGQLVYELAFLYDADGCLVELLHLKDQVTQQVESGWEPLDFQGIVASKN